MRPMQACLLVLSVVTSGVHADPQGDAQQLKDEALSILKANSSKAGTPEEYATCIMKLEKAQGLLDTANLNETPLAQEVSSSLFWARRFSNVDVINALQKMRGGAPAPIRKPAPAPAKPAPKPDPAVPADPPEVARAREADKAFAAAQSFVNAKADDDYAVALRWFQMAGEFAGTDAALKALELAREAQKRHLTKSGDTKAVAAAEAEETLPDGPGMDLVKQGDGFVRNKQYEQSLPLYRDALKQNDSPLVRRRLGKALYFQAQRQREILKPKFEANARDYQAAYRGAFKRTAFGTVFNPDDPNLARVKRETEALRKEGDVANKIFQEAENEFKAVLKVVEGGRDFEAAAYVGLCQCVRPFFKMQGKTTMEAVIKDYTPANDLERTLYEFCKAEIERIRYGR